MNSSVESHSLGEGVPVTRWTDILDSKNSVKLAFAALASILFLTSFYRKRQTVKAPFVGYRSFWEPTFILRLRFTKEAWPIVMSGYNKFKESMFRIRRNDTDILVISNKYVGELKALPSTRLNATQALVQNFKGAFTTINILLESDLHARVLRTRLLPNVGTFMGIMKEELDFATDVEIRSTEEYTPVAIYDVLLRTVARISARVFVGSTLCRNEAWLHASVKYTEDVFMTLTILRMTPSFLHPIVIWVLPSSYRVHDSLRVAKELITPLVNERRQAQATGNPDYKKPNDMLQWLMDAAVGDEARPDKLAHRMLLLSLAGIHTTTNAATHTLYDLCAHPEFFAPLREEMEEVLNTDEGWDKGSLTKLRKLDSFMMESQRFNPPALLSFNRVAKESLTLSDGVNIPKNTQLAVASVPILMDPAVVPNPEEFDPFRSYRKRLDPAEATRHQFATTDKDHLHFGHGAWACPGRFFATYEIKMMLSQLLLNYDFKYPEGVERPRNFTIDENVLVDPATKLLMKRRTKVQEQVPVAES